MPGTAALACSIWSTWSLWSGSGWHRAGSGRCSTRFVLPWRFQLLTLLTLPTLAQPPPRRRTAEFESEVGLGLGLPVRHAPHVASATSRGPLVREWQLTRFGDRLPGSGATRPMGGWGAGAGGLRFRGRVIASCALAAGQ